MVGTVATSGTGRRRPTLATRPPGHSLALRRRAAGQAPVHLDGSASVVTLAFVSRETLAYLQPQTAMVFAEVVIHGRRSLF